MTMFHATQASSPGAELALVDRTSADQGRASVRIARGARDPIMMCLLVFARPAARSWLQQLPGRNVASVDPVVAGNGRLVR
jgi:hypothetical protein